MEGKRGNDARGHIDMVNGIYISQRIVATMMAQKITSDGVLLRQQCMKVQAESKAMKVPGKMLHGEVLKALASGLNMEAV